MYFQKRKRLSLRKFSLKKWGTVGLEAMIFSLLGLECTEKLGESLKTFILPYHRVQQQLEGKNGRQKNLIFLGKVPFFNIDH